MEGVRLEQDQLIRTFGVSRRLAVRVGALLANGVSVSATILEIAGPGAPLEKLLLHAELLEKSEKLDKKLLQKLAKETGADSEGPLAIVEADGVRVIALEEELLAEERAPLALERTAAGAPALLHEEETRRLFNADEIARLKLEALAGPNEDARISAIRKLSFSPIGPQEKGGVFLRALLDSSGPVRAEAIKAIETLGFDRDTADAIRRLFEGGERAHHAALRRIGDLMDRLKPGEQRIVLAVLVELLREAHPKNERDPLLELFHEIAPAFQAHPEALPELTRVCVQRMLFEPARLGALMRDLLARLAAQNPEPVAGRLREELDAVNDPRARAMILGLLIEFDLDESRRERLCELTVEELLREDADEVVRQKLGHNMTKLGEPAAEALLRQFTGGVNRQRAMLAPFLDTIAVDMKTLSPETQNEIARQFLRALKSSDIVLRAEILRTRLFGQPAIAQKTKRELAETLVGMLKGDAAGSETADHAAGLLEQLGEDAAESLFTHVQAQPSRPAAAITARILGEALSQPEKNAALRDKAAAFLVKRLNSHDENAGVFAIALAKIVCAGEKTAQAREAMDVLFERLRETQHAGDILEAIGHIAARGEVSHEQRLKAAHLLTEIMERPASEDQTQMREVETSAGRVYEITGRIEFDSQTLPAAVRGLEAMAVSTRVTAALRHRILESMLVTWRQVAAWKVIWGPRASQRLAQALGRAASFPKAEDALRTEALVALRLGMERISVVRAMAEIFAAPSDDERFNERALESARQMLDDWIQPEISPEELEAVMRAATEAAARETISARSREAREFRERVTRLLGDALRVRHVWARELLEKLRDCPAMPKKLRAEIEERLSVVMPFN